MGILRKTILGLLLWFSITFNAYSDGGNRYNSCFSYYERENNLHYSSVQGQVNVQMENGKYKTFDATPNIAIHDNSNKTIKYIFDNETFDESIINLYFEQYYDSLKQSIVYNLPTDEYRYNEFIQNNFNIKKRKISGNLVIETYSFKTEKYSLWICDKNGMNLKKVYELNGKIEYHLDSYNKCIRIIKRLDLRNEIIEIAY